MIWIIVFALEDVRKAFLSTTRISSPLSKTKAIKNF